MKTITSNDILEYQGTYYKVVHSDKYDRPNLILLPQLEIIKLVREGKI
jgi:hypothetical protein